jgi:YVTN family beta-propeller protein
MDYHEHGKGQPRGTPTVKHAIAATLVLLFLTACGGTGSGTGGPDTSDDPAFGEVKERRNPADPDAAAETSEGPGPCSPFDIDGDGFGEECIAGPDCDEGNPNLNVYCPPCAYGIYPGCPCLEPGKTIQCYEHDPEYIGIGTCIQGEMTCVNGYWGLCEGDVEPMPEVCNGLDDDCDGVVDEGVLFPCGTCDPMCDDAELGPDSPVPFDPDEENSDGVELTEEGYIELVMDSVDLQHIWIANSAENTVSKLSTATGAELGRYAVCVDPSRTAVDLEGDVWVGCRGDGGVAKIRALPQDCEDQDGDGNVLTSTDKDGNGVISADEMLPAGQDECIAFVVFPGGGIQRAVGVDAENHAWVGEWNGSTLRRLAPDTGEVVQTIEGLPAQPYGLVVDAFNVIWISGRGGNLLVRVDPTAGTVSSFKPPQGSFSPYGITLDHFGRVWTANCCENNVAWRYDPDADEWAYAATGARPRGIAGCMDGRVYVANDEANQIAVVDTDTLETVATVNLGSGRYPIGMAADFDGYVWTVNQQAATAIKVSIDTLAIVGEFPVGSGPYTYSDMTGYLLHNFTTPDGHYTHVFGEEGFRLAWTSLTVEGDFPEGTSVKVRVRSADSPAELQAAPWYGPFGPYPPQLFPLDLVPYALAGALLEVELSLLTNKVGVTPTIKGIHVEFQSQ